MAVIPFRARPTPPALSLSCEPKREDKQKQACLSEKGDIGEGFSQQRYPRATAMIRGVPRA
jgi:hypothetical protein